jgi:hypothetical protein
VSRLPASLKNDSKVVFSKGTKPNIEILTITLIFCTFRFKLKGLLAQGIPKTEGYLAYTNKPAQFLTNRELIVRVLTKARGAFLVAARHIVIYDRCEV